MRAAMLRLSKLNVFVGPDGWNGCKFVLRDGEEEREKKWEDKIEARRKRKEARQVANEGRRRVGTFRDLSYLVKNRYSTSADTKLVAERTAVGKVSGTVVFIYYANRRWHQLDRAGRNIVEDATADAAIAWLRRVLPRSCCRWRKLSYVSRGTDSAWYSTWNEYDDVRDGIAVRIAQNDRVCKFVDSARTL